MMLRRNEEAHFVNMPSVGIERSRIDRSHSFKFSGDVGSVIPIYCDSDILPGDTVSMDTSKIVRFQTLKTPILDDMFADVFWFFIPHRLVWSHWKEFMGENTSSAWLPEVTYTIPKLRVRDPRSNNWDVNYNITGSLLDYMGFPVGINFPNTTDYIDINALPFRAYALVMNEFFRSENITDPLVINFGDSTVGAGGNSGDTYIQSVAKGYLPFKAAKTFDLFTSCLPSPQKGPSVSLPLGGDAPVLTRQANIPKVADGYDMTWYTASNLEPGNYPVEAAFSAESGHYGSTYLDASTGTGTPTAFAWPSNLWADLSQATAATISDLRMAFQLQRYYERLARSGSRYIEIIKGFFNVTSPDQRLQRPEYLGGNRFPIVIDQVTNSAQTDSDPLGDVGAVSKTSDIHSDFTHSFVEHGTLLGLMVIRYNHSYCQGVPKQFLRDTRLDFYWPTFAHISEQPIEKQELFLGATGTFGYNEAWSQYRHSPNRIAGEMRPYVSNSLGSWHLGDNYASAPSLSDAWLREDPVNVDRVLTVTSEVANQFWADIYFKCQYTRPMPLYSIPGLMDHF